MARYALVIGISQYCSPLKSLEKTATDAEAVAQVLEEYGEFVEVKRFPSRRNPQTQKREVVAKAVTGAELGQALQTLLLEQARQNEALIYFTGHGIIVSGNLGQPRGYLATSDCEIEAQGQRIISQKHGIGFDDLNDLISKSELSSLVVLLDCCHSGDFLERNLIDRSFSAFRSQQKDYYLITAGRSFQPVYARKNEKHSVFTGALLRGLAAENANSERRVSGDRLFDYITQELRGTEQEPLRLGWGTSLTLVTHPLLIVPPTLDVPATTAVNRENPYLGLRSFDSGQADYFFGRILAVRALLDRLNSGRFLAVIGPSGCGKSSLVKAGLLPYLKDDHIPGSNQWTVESFTPSTHPLESLQKALEQQNQPLLLFIDQFEEVFTLCEDEAERKDFISRITEEVTSSERFTRVIVAMRGDFLDRCAAYQEAAILINRTQPTTYFVTPFTLPELEEVIEKPADKHGVTFERGLVPQIIADVMNQPGGLPLLQYALAELWRVCITESSSRESQLTRKGYEQIRGVKGALEKRANDLYQNLAPADKVFVRRLFLSLVQLGEAKEVTRRRASWQDLEVEADSQEQLARVTRQLASQEQRLIITDEKMVEVAHEALLSEWGRLKEWIEQDRENLRLSRRLEAECKEWQRNDCSEGLLLTDAWLAAINDWVEKTQPRLSSIEQEFLKNSLEKRERKKQAELDQERQLRKAAEAKAQFTLAAGVLATLTFGFGFVAKLQQERAIRGEAVAAGALVSNSVNLYQSQNQLDALIEGIKALAALEKIGEATPEQLKELQSVIYKTQERNRFKHDGKVYGISFGSDGKTFVSTGDNKIIRLWNLQGKLLDTSSIQQDKIYNVKFGTDGKLASASFDGTVKIWRIEQEKLIDTQIFTKVSGEAYGIAFDPKNSNLVAISDSNGRMKVWDASKTNMNIVEDIDARDYIKKGNLPNLKGYGIYSIDFSPDGEVIAYGYEEGGVYIWDWKNSKSPRLIGEHKTVISTVKFSPDGLTLSSASNDGIIQLWDVGKNYALKGQIDAYDKYILGLAFSPDNRNLASSSLNEPIKIWDLRQTEERYKTGQPLLNNEPITITGYNSSVRQIEFHPKNNNLILSASDDTTVRLWAWNFNRLNDKASQSSETLLRDSCKAIWDYANTNSNSQEVKETCYKYNRSM